MHFVRHNPRETSISATFGVSCDVDINLLHAVQHPPKVLSVPSYRATQLC